MLGPGRDARLATGGRELRGCGVAEEERSPVPDVVGSAGNSAASGLVRLALSGKGPEAIM